MTTSKRHIIKPCNNVYKATTTMAIALTGIPENIFQSGVGIVIALVCYPIISRIYTK